MTPFTTTPRKKAKLTHLEASDQADSITAVHLAISEPRVPFTIKCKPELKEALKEFCEANGLSTCHIFEGLVSAYLYAMKEKIEWVHQSPTINLTLVRDVKRLRRYGYSAINNFYDCSLGSWLHVDGELNSNGHGVGCACSLCCPTVLKRSTR